MVEQPWFLSWDALSYVTDQYGRIIGGHSVQVAVERTLATWLPTYIYEFNRQLGGDILTVPKKYERMPDDRTAPRRAEAAILVNTNGTMGEPERRGNGSYDVSWEVDVTVWMFGTKDFLETQALTYAYAAAVRSAIMQHRSLLDFATDTSWTAESYQYGQFASARYIGQADIKFEVMVKSAMNDLLGPPLASFAADPDDAIPSLEPTPLQPDVETVGVTVSNVPASESV